jgi:hypothetical protein
MPNTKDLIDALFGQIHPQHLLPSDNLLHLTISTEYQHLSIDMCKI